MNGHGRQRPSTVAQIAQVIFVVFVVIPMCFAGLTFLVAAIIWTVQAWLRLLA
jgi:hypothetical protein